MHAKQTHRALHFAPGIFGQLALRYLLITSKVWAPL